jgi:hypothetical protein
MTPLTSLDRAAVAAAAFTAGLTIGAGAAGMLIGGPHAQTTLDRLRAAQAACRQAESSGTVSAVFVRDCETIDRDLHDLDVQNAIELMKSIEG